MGLLLLLLFMGLFYVGVNKIFTTPSQQKKKVARSISYQYEFDKDENDLNNYVDRILDEANIYYDVDNQLPEVSRKTQKWSPEPLIEPSAKTRSGKVSLPRNGNHRKARYTALQKAVIWKEIVDAPRSLRPYSYRWPR